MEYYTSISDIFLHLVILLVLSAFPVILDLFEWVDKKYPRKKKKEKERSEKK